MNSHFYLDVLKRFQSRVKRARKEIANSWRLLDVKTLLYTNFIVTGYLAKCWVAILPQLQYSPFLDPADYFLFPRIKMEFKDHQFETL
ncbi:hypothetical protein NPIL_59561 [Nephila pilipes]|uniref:Uncharacterized protein n=1 Tax=Nephila pilipes TaxID=299642 RepID=A0A8X6N3Y1_NEPPI|nr:hypothetical protein NPIL_59561 [Nephila pilipes]